MADGNTALATKKEVDAPQLTVKSKLDQWFDKRKSDMALVLGNPERAAKFYTAAMQAIQRSPDLLDCTPQSLALCIFTSAQLGLKPGPSQECAYVGFNNKGTREATFIPMYKGLVKLAMNTGIVSSIYAETVYENDTFHFSRGDTPRIDHSWIIDQVRGEMIGVYAIAKTSSGGTVSIVMSRKEVEAIKAKSRAAGSSYSPWNTDEWTTAEMWKKTAIKRLSKILPMDDEKFVDAIEIDNAAERPDLRQGVVVPLIGNGDSDGLEEGAKGRQEGK